MTEQAITRGQEKTEQHQRPAVYVLQDAELSEMRLSMLVRESNCTLFEIFPNAELPDLSDAIPGPALIMMTVADRTDVERIQEVRTKKRFRDVPILGVSPFPSFADRRELAALGVVGLVDRLSDADHVIFRINQVVRNLCERRRGRRARTVLPVEVTAGGKTSAECVVSLSAGGAGLASSRSLSANTDVSIKFDSDRLAQLGVVPGRVTRTVRTADSLPAYQVGVVFYPLSGAQQALLEEEVAALVEEAQVRSPIRRRQEPADRDSVGGSGI